MRERNTWREYMLRDTKDLKRDYDLTYTFEKNLAYLFQVASGIWKYNGIEEDNKRFPVELEKRLFYMGLSGIVKHENKCTAVDASPYGLDVYGLPTEFNFTFRNGETPDEYSKEIGVDGVLAYNTFMYIPTYYFAFDYAVKLAHIDLSIIAETVNTRSQDVFIADNDAGRDSANAYYNGLYMGKLQAIVNKANCSFSHETRDRARGTNLVELFDARKSVLAEFYSLMGVKRLPDKKERLITEEVKNDSALMLLNISEMWECRKKALEECNALYGTSYSVECLADIDGNGTPEDEENDAIERTGDNGNT